MNLMGVLIPALPSRHTLVPDGLLPLVLGFAVFAGLLAAQESGPRDRLALDGVWSFELDPEDIGQKQGWFAGMSRMSAKIRVPGAWQAQGVGKPVGVLRHHYEGAAWYGRNVAVPSAWHGKKIELVVGGAFTYTTAYVNGLLAGVHEGFSTPFRFDITPLVKPGSTNAIVLRVVNVKDPLKPQRRVLNVRDTSDLAGALNFAAPWGGIYRSVSLEAHEPVWVERIAITTAIAPAAAKLTVRLRNDSDTELQGEVDVRIVPRGGSEGARGATEVRLPAGSAGEVGVTVPVADARLWSPESPNLYEARVALRKSGRTLDSTSQVFGFREIRTEGQKLLLNGRPLYLRGYGDDSSEMLTGAPPSDKAVYLERLRTAKALGFNAVRFHSTTPAAECFEAADEVGILVAAELPVAYQEYLLPHKDLLRNEVVRIIDTHRNHPSFFFFTMGNEFGLHRIPDERAKEVFLVAVRELVLLAKSRYPELLVSSNSGYLVPPMDVAVPYRGLATDLPNIKHEYGAYYSTLPDPSLMPSFTGPFQPLWLSRAKTWIEQNRLAAEYRIYLVNSWRLHAAGVKTYIERLRSIREFTGYFYWLINDYPGGTPEGAEWNWGWLDLFWQSKYITPRDGREMNAAVLPLIDSPVNSRTLWLEEGKTIEVLLSNFGESAIADGKLAWELRAGGELVAAGRSSATAAPLGTIARIGQIRIGKLAGREAQGFDLEISVAVGSATYSNRWKLWGFPRAGLLAKSDIPVSSLVKSAALKRFFPFIREGDPPAPPGVLVASDFSPPVLDFLQHGGRVLLLAEPGRFGGRTAYFPGSGGALGLRIDTGHVSLRGFPNDGYPDLQFYNLLEGGTQFALSPKLPDIIGGLRMTRTNRENVLSRVTFLSEARVGKGRLLFCGLNVRPNLDETCPEALYLFDRLLRYVASAEFEPAVGLAVEVMDEIRVPYTEMIH